MCFWYCTGVATGPLVSSRATSAASVGCDAITSSRPGWSSPVAARYAAYSGSSTTEQSARFSKLRISAVERLRGPDHIAIRTVIAATPGRTART